MAKVSLRAYNREIEAMIDRGQLDEAIANCQHILKTFSKHLETYRLLGKAYLEYKRYKDAVDIFMRVLAAEPNDFVSNVGVSIIRDEGNKLDDAIWHMERAFEVQPSNSAIQGELQRLYARRDGVQPPRIRMTRGALAHMYVQGELYPQAISEIKSVLKEDQGRSDMQVLLARAYFKSGQKNDAAEAANSVLRRYPYCLDANRVLVEILSVDKPENAQIYRQRVYELDPYAAQVTGTIFQSNEVSDNAVGLEHLDWNGQPVRMQPDWESTKAIAPESGFGNEAPAAIQPPQSGDAEPDWLKMGLTDSTPPPPSNPTVVPTLPAASSPFDSPAPSEDFTPAVPTEEENIPDFLKAAGWGKSTGEFDESQSAFADEPEPSTSQGGAIEQADLPDWVKAMMPQETGQATAAAQGGETAQPAEEEELPDWIKNIGTGALSASALKSTENQADWMQPSEEASSTSTPAVEGQPDWMQGFDQPAQSISSAEQPDWMKGLEQPATSESFASTEDSMDWLKGLDQAETTPPAQSADQPDWMKGFEQPAKSESFAAPEDSMDWLKGLDPAETSSAAQSTDQPDWTKSMNEPVAQQPGSVDELDWLKGVGEESELVSETSQMEQPDWLTQFGNPPSETPAAEVESAPATDELDFLDEITEKPIEPSLPTMSTTDTGSLGKSEQERDDSFAWLEALAAKQGASEGLLTKPEERLQEEPDWVKQAKGMTDVQPTMQQPPSQTVPAANAEDLGKSDQERDDSFAWLENLAAKQGATEGLLTKPEERMEEEPEWVKQAKSTPQTPAPAQPVASVEELGKSEQERDDSFAWLENLAAKQGATEGLLTKPEERMEEEPEWVKQAKTAPPTPIQPVANVEELGKSDQERDDSFAWLENLAAKQGATEGLLTKPEERMEDEPEWVKQAKTAPQLPTQPVANVEELGKSEQERDDSFAWLENLAAKQGATEGLLTKPEERMEDEPEWVKQAKSAPQQPESVSQEPTPSAADDTAWLHDLEKEESASEPISSSDATAMWFKKLEEPEPTPEPEPVDDMPAWLSGLDQLETPPERTPAADSTAMWLKGLDEPPVSPEQPTEQAEDIPAWLKGIEEEEKAPVVEAAVPEASIESAGEFDWLDDIEDESAVTSEVAAEEEGVPSWLKGLEEESNLPETGSLRNLPGWMRDETGEVVAEPTKIEPTRSSDWQPVEEKQPEEPAPQPQLVEPPKPQPTPEPVAVQPVEEEPKPKPTPAPRKPKPAAEPKPEPYREPVTSVRGTGMLTMPPVDSILGSARNELSRSNIPGALDAYSKLIKKGRFLDEIIFDLREASYRYPVEVSIWQSLGDAYMRANRLQDALDAYTKAEELLR